MRTGVARDLTEQNGTTKDYLMISERTGIRVTNQEFAAARVPF